MGEQSQALEFVQFKFKIERSDDFMEINSRRIRNMKELRDVLNELDPEQDDFGIYLTGTTEDGHTAHFRFYSQPKEGALWYWGYISFVLDKLDSQAERLLQKIRDILR